MRGMSKSQLKRIGEQMGQRVLVPDRPADPDCNDYTLTPGHESVWISVNNISVLIKRTGEGVIVDLWPKGKEHEVLGTTAVMFTEAQEVIDDPEIAA